MTIISKYVALKNYIPMGLPKEDDFEININSFKGSLDLSHLNRGIYFIKASSNSGLIHKKIILN